MRILYHHRTLADGAEGIHISSMIHAFRQLGHDVLLDGVDPGTAAAARPRFVGRLRSSLPQAAFELATAAYNVREFWRLRAVIRSFRPDMLYTRHARLAVASVRAARAAGVPSVLEVNCLYTQGAYVQFEPVSFAALATRMEREALRLATTVAAVSTPLERQIRALVDRPVLLTPNGADPARFDPERAQPDRVRAQHKLEARLVVGWSGILREWHGLDLLLDAVAQVPAVTLLIVGDGPARSSLERHAAQSGIADRVVITGRVAHEEMPDYMAAMDVAVVAGERTGVASPMKLLEYMAMGRAVVAPRADNIRDVVSDTVDGLLFTPGSVPDLAGTLRRLASDVALRLTLGRTARARIEAERNWRRIAETILQSVPDFQT